MSSSVTYLQQLLQKVTNKCEETDDLENEYDELENVPPAPGRRDQQHNSMIKNKLCELACQNKDKNRYTNLYPFDKDIFRFSDKEQYINASWVDFGEGFRYILTMAPMHQSSYSFPVKNTCPDFWEMCWQTKTKVIVMLCSVSPGFSGCSQYFPANPGTSDVHGLITVKLKKAIEFADYIERELILSRGSESHTIHHFYFKEWPIYDAPEGGVSSVSEFLTYVHKRSTELNAGLDRSFSPYMLVHCSGGIGRSGTFLTVFVTYSKLLELRGDSNVPGSPNLKFEEGILLKDLVSTMRMQRHPWMVEGLHQYSIAYAIVIELIKNQIEILSLHGF